MDMMKILSVKGFVAYYLQYCTRMDEVTKKSRKFQEVGKDEEIQACVQEIFDIVHELRSVTDKYTCLCTLTEIQEALDAYPEDSDEHTGLKMLLREKQFTNELISKLLGF